MAAPAPARLKREIPIVLARTALLSFTPVSRAAALALTDLGIAAFFISGVTQASLGASAPWFVLALVLLGVSCRAVDIESWSLFMPGGLVARVREAFGPRSAATAAAATLVERLLLAALSCVVVGHYVAAWALGVIGGPELLRQATPEDLSTLVAVLLFGFLWFRNRIGYPADNDQIVRHGWITLAVLGLLAVWGLATFLVRQPPLPPLPGSLDPAFLPVAAGSPRGLAPTTLLILTLLGGLGQALPALGGGEGLARVASELEPPRIRGLQRTALVVGAYALFITAGLAFLFGSIVPEPLQAVWFDAPLVGLAQQLGGPGWLRGLITAAVVAASGLMLGHAAHLALMDSERTLFRLSQLRFLPQTLRLPHPRFGTPARVIDAAAAAIVLIMIASSGRVAWLARAYAVALVWTFGFKVAALVRLRGRQGGPTFRVPLTLRFAGREWPLGLWLIGALVVASGLAMLLSGDAATLTGTGTLVSVAMLFVLAPRHVEPAPEAEEAETFQLLPSAELSLEHVKARPGCVLVAVRNPHSLGHVTAALETAGDRDIVVMTARLVDIDGEGENASDARPTTAERVLFSKVLTIAERYGRPVRFLIVPANNVFDAAVAAIMQLQASEMYVGESVSISAEAQARLLGEAWERSAKTEGSKVRLVIYHHTGRIDAFHLGAHAPALTPSDLDLIHRLWLDATKAVGSHVHHHDVVRAALNQMAEQLTGSDREQALQAIRRVAKPADELAGMVRARDFSQLRDMVRNRPPSDLATLLSELSVEDQVIVFRLLPRKDAAATFEYLSHEAQEALLKAMALEDVASILNNMAPDDRTMFLEELPATVTRQLLALLTPEERSVALTLLGYPEGSIGRLMTPQYVAVQEDWTIQQVLDYVRRHGQDSETLNVIYVVDAQGLLIDDLRIREVLLAEPTSRVSDLMDRHCASLRATDDEETAVAAFRRHDRVALPVTDTVGVLIGIVTIDDVLEVAETTATKDIHRIGGLEALDEPYMLISFGRMIRKRGGWLTALFLGEMLTATAMGVFQQEISRAIVLTLFIPLIISSGGNSGSQASTLVIRALALGEVTLRDWWRVMRREIGAGLALGAILGTIGFFRITLWSAFSDIYGPHWFLVALTVGMALLGIVLWGTLIGSLLPFLLRRLGFDPATSSAPFVATLVDVTGLVIYFTVAMIILRGTLL